MLEAGLLEPGFPGSCVAADNGGMEVIYYDGLDELMRLVAFCGPYVCGHIGLCVFVCVGEGPVCGLTGGVVPARLIVEPLLLVCLACAPRGGWSPEAYLLNSNLICYWYYWIRGT